MKVKLAIVAGVGFVISAAAHVAALGGFVLGGEGLMFGYFAGIFVPFIPTVGMLVKKYPKWEWKVIWSRVLADCPKTIRYVMYVMVVYAVVNYVYLVSTGTRISHNFGEPLSAAKAAGFSAQAMLFYVASAAILLSLHRGEIRESKERGANEAGR